MDVPLLCVFYNNQSSSCSSGLPVGPWYHFLVLMINVSQCKNFFKTLQRFLFSNLIDIQRVWPFKLFKIHKIFILDFTKRLNFTIDFTIDLTLLFFNKLSRRRNGQVPFFVVLWFLVDLVFKGIWWGSLRGGFLGSVTGISIHY